MSVDPPTYLTALQNNIRTRPIPWDGAVRAGTVLEWQLTKIRAVDKVKKDVRKQAVESDLDGYRILFAGGARDDQPSVLQSAARRTDVVQYILVLLNDLLEAIPSLARAILATSSSKKAKSSSSEDPYRNILPLLAHSNNADDPIPLLTATVLTTLLANARDESSATLERALPALLSYLSTLAQQSADAGLQDIGVLESSSLLYGRATRKQFWAQRSETVAPLVKILRTAAGVSTSGGEDTAAGLWRATGGGPNGSATGNGGDAVASRIGAALLEGSIGGGVGLQLLYHVLLVLWQLSFDAADIGDDLNE